VFKGTTIVDIFSTSLKKASRISFLLGPIFEIFSYQRSKYFFTYVKMYVTNA